VRHATGIDVTPAMLSRARELTAGLANVTLDQGDVQALPYADGTFSIVVSRFAFHHFPDPAAVLREMRRVCRPGGRVVVCDLLASDDPEKAASFHRIEMLRDPSHVRALTLAELEGLFAAQGIAAPAHTYYKLPFELEGLLERSFPRPRTSRRSARPTRVGRRRHARAWARTARATNRAAYPVAILAAGLRAADARYARSRFVSITRAGLFCGVRAPVLGARA
jgi:SAM-dependent methyltransferase